MLTFPLVMTVALIAPPYLLYLTPLYESSLRSAAVSVGLVIAGFLYFWTRLRVHCTPRTDPYVLSIGISIQNFPPQVDHSVRCGSSSEYP
jgi:cytochrome c oxidase assembly factor CtaG